MAFFTRPRLDDLQFQQQTSDNLTLSGSTIFAKTIGGLSLQDQFGNPIPVDATVEGTGVADPINNGKTLVVSGGTIILGQGGGGGAAFLNNVGNGSGLIFKNTTGGTSNLRSLSGGTGVNIITSGDVITITSEGGLLGDARDVWGDGLFDFNETTPTGFAVDDINEFLGLLSPKQPPILDDQSTSGGFVAGKLSFGVSRNDILYENVTSGQGGSALDINDNFPTSGDRKGLTQNSILNSNQIVGVLNDDVNDGNNVTGIPYENDAFRDGDSGILSLELNGNIIDTLDLTTTSNSFDGDNGYLNVSEEKPVKFDNGNDFGTLVYRKGGYEVPSSLFRTGYNYIRVIHTSSNFNRITNYTNWVYDSNTDAITFLPVNSGNDFKEVNLFGSKYLSGVQYYRTGNVVYEGIASNVYKNVYSNSNNAISFVNRVNLSNTLISISVVGSGIINGTSEALPNLDSGVSNPQDTDITITATLPINNSRVLGGKTEANSGSLPSGELRSSINILHPFDVKAYNKSANTTESAVSETGVLLYNIDQSSNNSREDFNGEVNRLQSRNYTGTLYSNLNGSLYNWNSQQSLIGGDSLYNTGLLVFNGALYYPNATLLNTEYSITNGDFDSITYSPANNVNYTSAGGTRNYYRKFQSTNTTALASIQGIIDHTGDASTFLTQAGTAGSPTGNQIKFEILIKRVDGTTIGYANPFSTDFASQAGISNTSLSHSGGRTSFTFTLGQGRLGDGDILIARLFVGSGYNQKISLIEFTNIS